MGYEQIRVTDELSRSVQRAVGVLPRRHETLGEMVMDVAAERLVQEPANLVTDEGVEGLPLGTEEGSTCETLCPYLNAFPSRVDYERWTERTLQAVTVALSLGEAIDLARDWISGPARGLEEESCCC